MTTLYARHDVEEVVLASGRVLTLKAVKVEEGERRIMSVDVDPAEVEEVLAIGHFATHRASVPMSPDELIEQEHLRDEGSAALRHVAAGVISRAREEKPATTRRPKKATNSRR